MKRRDREGIQEKAILSRVVLALLLMATLMALPTALFADDEGSVEPAAEAAVAPEPEPAPAPVEPPAEPAPVEPAPAEPVPAEPAPSTPANPTEPEDGAPAPGEQPSIEEGLEETASEVEDAMGLSPLDTGLLSFELLNGDSQILPGSVHSVIHSATVVISGPIGWSTEDPATPDIEVLFSLTAPDSTSVCEITAQRVRQGQRPSGFPSGSLVYSTDTASGTFEYRLSLSPLAERGDYTVGGILADNWTFSVDFDDSASVKLQYGQVIPDVRAWVNGIGGVPELPANGTLRLAGIRMRFGGNERNITTTGSTVNLDSMNADFLGFNPRRPEALNNSNLSMASFIALTSGSPQQVTAVRSTFEALVNPALIEESDSQYSFEVILGSASPGWDNVFIYVEVCKVQIILDGHSTLPVPYGADVRNEINEPGFIDSVASLRSVGTGGFTSYTIAGYQNASAFIAQNTEAFELTGNSSSSGSYPDSDGWFRFTWKNSLSFSENNHRYSVTIDESSLTCYFAEAPQSLQADLVLNSEGSPCVYDSYTGSFWVNTAEATLLSDGKWVYCTSLLWPTGNPVPDTVIDGSIPRQVGSIEGLIAKYTGSDPSVPPAIRLVEVRSDTAPPTLTGVAPDGTNVVGVRRMLVSDTTIAITLSFADSGGSGLCGFTLRYEDEDGNLILNEDGDPLVDLDVTFDRAPGQQASSSLSYTFYLDEADYPYDLSMFKLVVYDVAGNSSTDYTLSASGSGGKSEYDYAFIDVAGPSVSIAFADGAIGGGYYTADRAVTITIWSLSFPALDPGTAVAWRTDGGQTSAITASMFDETDDPSVWVFPATFSEGRYRLVTDYEDPLGRRADPQADSGEFIIDKTPPMVMVEFDNMDSHSFGYYNAPRTATITVYEENFDPALVYLTVTATDAYGNAAAAPGISGWSSPSNAEHVATIYFGQELTYELKVSAADLAGHDSGEAVTEGPFTIDMTAPEIDVAGVLDTMAYSGEVAPVVTFFDFNIDGWASRADVTRANTGEPYYSRTEGEAEGFTKSVSFADFPAEAAYDDVYYLDASAIDLAGNETVVHLVFSVNRFGSTYWFDPATASLHGTYTSRRQDLVIHEVNVSGVDESRCAISVGVDDRVLILTRGEGFELAARTPPGTLWRQYTYVIPSSVLETDGFYNVTVRSFDLAGNFSESAMPNKSTDRSSPALLSFTLDTLAPSVQLIGLNDGTAYLTDRWEFQVLVSDNIGWAEVVLRVNGKEQVRYSSADSDADENPLSKMVEYALAGSDGEYTVEVTATDKAGNTTTVKVTGVRVNGSVLEILRSLSPIDWWGASSGFRIFAVALPASAGAVGLMLFFIFWRRRKRDELESQIAFAEGEPAPTVWEAEAAERREAFERERRRREGGGSGGPGSGGGSGSGRPPGRT